MKKVKGKYIRLTEDELKQIIKESLNNLILEYSMKRKDYFIRCVNLSQQIIENWCLVHYCTIINEDINRCKNHWKKELFSHMATLSEIDLKDNNSTESRIKVIQSAFEENDLITSKQILKKIGKKFIIEGINLKDENISILIENCSKSINDIIYNIANYDLENLKEYINKI